MNKQNSFSISQLNKSTHTYKYIDFFTDQLQLLTILRPKQQQQQMDTESPQSIRQSTQSLPITHLLLRQQLETSYKQSKTTQATNLKGTNMTQDNSHIHKQQYQLNSPQNNGSSLSYHNPQSAEKPIPHPNQCSVSQSQSNSLTETQSKQQSKSYPFSQYKSYPFIQYKSYPFIQEQHLSIVCQVNNNNKQTLSETLQPPNNYFQSTIPSIEVQKPITLVNPTKSLLSQQLQCTKTDTKQLFCHKRRELRPMEEKFISWTKQFLSQIGMKNTVQTLNYQSHKNRNTFIGLDHQKELINQRRNPSQVEINQIEDNNQPFRQNTTKALINEQDFLKQVSQLQNAQDIFSFCQSVVQSNSNNLNKSEINVSSLQKDIPQLNQIHLLHQCSNKTKETQTEEKASLQKKMVSDMFCHYFSTSVKITLPIHQTLLYQHPSPIKHVFPFNNTTKSQSTQLNHSRDDSYESQGPGDKVRAKQLEQNQITQFILSDKRSHLYHSNIKGETLRKDKVSMKGITKKRVEIIALTQIFNGRYFATVLQNGVMKIFKTSHKLTNPAFDQPSEYDQWQLRHFRIQRQSSRQVFRGSSSQQETKNKKKQKHQQFNYIDIISLLVNNCEDNNLSTTQSRQYSITCAQATILSQVPFMGDKQQTSTYLQVTYQLSPKDQGNIGGSIVVKIIKFTQIGQEQQKNQRNQRHQINQRNQRNQSRYHNMPWLRLQLQKQAHKQIKLNAQLLYQKIIPNHQQILYQNLHLYQFRNQAQLNPNQLEELKEPHQNIKQKPSKHSYESDDQSSNQSQTQPFKKQYSKSKHPKYPSPIQQDYRRKNIQRKQKKKLQKYLKMRSQFFANYQLQDRDNLAMQGYVNEFLTKFNKISNKQLKKRNQTNFFKQFIAHNFKIIGHVKQDEEGRKTKTKIVKRIELIELNGDVGSVFVCKENEYINCYKVIRQQNVRKDKTSEQISQNNKVSLKQYIYLFITGYETKRLKNIKERVKQKNIKEKQNTVAYRRIMKINYMGAVIEEYPMFEYCLSQDIWQSQEEQMVDLTIERESFIDFYMNDMNDQNEMNMLKTEEILAAQRKKHAYSSKQKYKTVNLNQIEQEGLAQTPSTLNKLTKLNSNKATDFLIYPLLNLIVVGTSTSIIYYSMRQKKILLSVRVDQSITDAPISKLIKIDQTLSQFAYIRGQFLQILDINKQQMVKKYSQRKSLKSILGRITHGLPRSYVALLRQLLREHPQIFNTRLS